MTRVARTAFAVLVFVLLGCQLMQPSPSAEPVPVVPVVVVVVPAATGAEFGLVPFASDEGLRRLARADSKRGFASLASRFEAEMNGAFCGPTTAAIVVTIVLNIVCNRSADFPRDRNAFARATCRATRKTT